MSFAAAAAAVVVAVVIVVIVIVARGGAGDMSQNRQRQLFDWLCGRVSHLGRHAVSRCNLRPLHTGSR